MPFSFNFTLDVINCGINFFIESFRQFSLQLCKCACYQQLEVVRAMLEHTSQQSPHEMLDVEVSVVHFWIFLLKIEILLVVSMLFS